MSPGGLDLPRGVQQQQQPRPLPLLPLPVQYEWGSATHNAGRRWRRRLERIQHCLSPEAGLRTLCCLHDCLSLGNSPFCPPVVSSLAGVVRSGQARGRPTRCCLSVSSHWCLPIFGQVMVFRSLLVNICFHLRQQPRPTYLLTIDHCDSFNVLKAFVGLINVDIESWFSIND